MAVWRRYMVRESTGRMVDLPCRAFDGADDGTAPLPGYAGRCVDLVSATLIGRPGTCPRLAEIAYTKLYFDDCGFVDAGKRERMVRLLLESCADARAGVPPLEPGQRARAGAARNELAREFGWSPAPAEVSEVLVRLTVLPDRFGRTVH